MNYKVDLIDKKAKITIELTKDEWQDANEVAYQKTKYKYGIAGFRKGHTPKRVIMSMYGEEVFYNDALNDVFPKYYGEVLDKEKDLFVISDPKIDFEKIDAEGLIMTLEVELKPEVVVENYKGIKVEKPEYNVTDADIDAELDKARERVAREVAVEGRAVEDGDITIIDYSGSVDGTKFEGGTAEKQELIIGSKKFIPGFEEQIIGMNIGDEKDIEVVFPENYSPDLAGKKAVFAIKLHEIKKKELPELNDDFAKDVSEFDTLQAYKDDIKAKLVSTNEKRADEERTNLLIEKIADGVNIEVPQSMIDRQIENQIKMNSQQAKMYYGMDFEQILKMQGQTIEDFKKIVEPDAKKKVKTSLIFEAIIKQEKIEADQKEIDDRIVYLANSIKKDPEEYKKSVTDQQIEYIKEDLVTEKLIKFLKENNF